MPTRNVKTGVKWYPSDSKEDLPPLETGKGRKHSLKDRVTHEGEVLTAYYIDRDAKGTFDKNDFAEYVVSRARILQVEPDYLLSLVKKMPEATRRIIAASISQEED